jgi:hypothetical protein
MRRVGTKMHLGKMGEDRWPKMKHREEQNGKEGN